MGVVAKSLNVFIAWVIEDLISVKVCQNSEKYSHMSNICQTILTTESHKFLSSII